MSYTLLRNATAMLTIGGQFFLIDPALDPSGARPPVANTPNQRPNPLVELPESWSGTIAPATAAVVTHMHQDHFDESAIEILEPELPLLCQPDDAERLKTHGFTDVRTVERSLTFGEVDITRTAGNHGTGEIGERMAPVSGFVFHAEGEPVVYVAGDTIWCEEVSNAIAVHQPGIIVVNASGARFLEGDPIVMTAEDVAYVHEAAPESWIVVVHLEAINHCLETRAHYRERLPALGVDMNRVRVPDDGEVIRW